MSELALDDVQWDALAQEFERVLVAQLVWREAAAHAALGGATAWRVRLTDAARVLVGGR
jgi:hypothetical protein